MHRTGHWLGMDVHDCGSYVEPSQVGEISERKDPLSGEIIKNRPSRILQPGMVLTIEPGIYVRPGEGVPEQFHHIGIRIEDDAVVSDDRSQWLRADLARRAGGCGRDRGVDAGLRRVSRKQSTDRFATE